MKNKDHHTAHAISDKNISIETVNAAKRRLIELAPVEKTVAELEKNIERRAYFTGTVAILSNICETVIVLLTVGQIYHFATGDQPLDVLGFLSIIAGIVIAGLLTRRLDGWRRVKRDEAQLRRLKQQIEDERTEAEKIIG